MRTIIVYYNTDRNLRITYIYLPVIINTSYITMSIHSNGIKCVWTYEIEQVHG